MSKKATAKTPAGPPSFVKAEKKIASEDKLKAIRDLVAEARSNEKKMSDLQEQLKELSAAVNDTYQKKLPDLYQEVGIDNISLPADGNYPAVDAKLQDYYSANIAAGWAPERRQEAFKWLEDHGHGDLIKTAVSAQLPREKRAAAKKLIALIEKAGFAAEVKEAVHSGTLSAWLKEQIELGAPIPPLELIGGSIGKVVRLKERKS